MDGLVTIGAFARLSRLTPKALRLYAERGLLRPAVVDRATGYRYYRPDQVDRARLIGWLRRLELPLGRIAELLDAPPDQVRAAVEEHRARLAAATAERDRLAGLVQRHLAGSRAGIRYAASVDTGRVRSTNEDSALATRLVLAVADGVSGPAGAAASAAAVGALADWRPHARPATYARSAAWAVRGVAGPAVTTLTALLRAGPDRFAVLHIGDTRAYLLRRHELTQVTRDDTEARSLVDSSVPWRPALLSRALTAGGSDQPDVSTHDIRPADRWLLASDGLTAVVPHDEMHDLLGTAREPDVAVEQLVAAAHRAGAPDNIACVVADVLV